MNRRGFLGTLLSAAVLDPEKLLWVPGQKLISIPSGKVLEPAVEMPIFDLKDGVLKFVFRAQYKQQIEQEIASIRHLVDSKIWFSGADWHGVATAAYPNLRFHD